MSTLSVAGLMFGCAVAAAGIAMLIARRLPDHHLSSESKELVKLGLGVIATLTALVLGLLVASAKATYDAQDAAVKEIATDLSMLDRCLVIYGPETTSLRELMAQMTTQVLHRMWPEKHSNIGTLSVGAEGETGNLFYTKVAELEPKTEVQRTLKARLLDLTADLATTRYRMLAQRESSTPLPLLLVVILWVVALFFGYGLLAPRNATAIAVLLISAFSIAAALYLVLELGRPFSGLIQISSDPVRQTLGRMKE